MSEHGAGFSAAELRVVERYLSGWLAGMQLVVQVDADVNKQRTAAVSVVVLQGLLADVQAQLAVPLVVTPVDVLSWEATPWQLTHHPDDNLTMKRAWMRTVTTVEGYIGDAPPDDDKEDGQNKHHV
jgi:hypothetical protein